MIRLALMPLLLIGLAVPSAKAEDAALWRLVAQSDVIAIGVVEAPSEPLPAKEYVELRLSDAQPLKGAIRPSATIRWYSEPQDYAPSAEQIRAASGRPSLVFSLRSEGQFYFAGHTPSALRTADARSVADVRAEVARQDEVVANWRPDPSIPHHSEVQAIIEQVAALAPVTQREEQRRRSAEQQSLFDALIALGPAAVPAIIEQMDDARPLASPQLSLINHVPDAFEGMRHYGPKLMVEALAAILNQLTGESFGFIYNGGAALEREASVRGWRVYLDHLRHNPDA